MKSKLLIIFSICKYKLKSSPVQQLKSSPFLTPMKSLKYILLLISLFSYLLPANAIWLSVDPLSNKYPHISPYAYCGNNPIKFVDPDGRFPLISPLIGYLALARTMESTQRNHEVKTVG